MSGSGGKAVHVSSLDVLILSYCKVYMLHIHIILYRVLQEIYIKCMA